MSQQNQQNNGGGKGNQNQAKAGNSISGNYSAMNARSMTARQFFAGTIADGLAYVGGSLIAYGADCLLERFFRRHDEKKQVQIDAANAKNVSYNPRDNRNQNNQQQKQQQQQPKADAPVALPEGKTDTSADGKGDVADKATNNTENKG